MYNLELFVIAIYCFIEDELYPAFCWKASNGYMSPQKRPMKKSHAIHRTR